MYAPVPMYSIRDTCHNNPLGSVLSFPPCLRRVTALLCGSQASCPSSLWKVARLWLHLSTNSIGIRYCATASGFYLSSGNLNSQHQPYDIQYKPLSSEPPPQTKFQCFKKFLYKCIFSHGGQSKQSSAIYVPGASEHPMYALWLVAQSLGARRGPG